MLCDGCAHKCVCAKLLCFQCDAYYCDECEINSEYRGEKIDVCNCEDFMQIENRK